MVNSRDNRPLGPTQTDKGCSLRRWRCLSVTSSQLQLPSTDSFSLNTASPSLHQRVSRTLQGGRCSGGSYRPRTGFKINITHKYGEGHMSSDAICSFTRGRRRLITLTADRGADVSKLNSVWADRRRLWKDTLVLVSTAWAGCSVPLSLNLHTPSPESQTPAACYGTSWRQFTATGLWWFWRFLF